MGAVSADRVEVVSADVFTVEEEDETTVGALLARAAIPYRSAVYSIGSARCERVLRGASNEWMAGRLERSTANNRDPAAVYSGCNARVCRSAP